MGVSNIKLSKNTLNNTSDNTLSIHPVETAQAEETPAENFDGPMESAMQIMTTDAQLNDGAIPYFCKNNEHQMKRALKDLMGYDSSLCYANRNDFFKSSLSLLLDCLTEMTCADQIQTYRGSTMSYAKVIDKLNECVAQDHSLEDFVNETIDDYISAASKKEIRDKKKYMKAVIWNSLSTYKVKVDSSFARTYLSI